MRYNAAQVTSFALLAAVAACGGGSGGALERDDVTNLPAGDATGIAASGHYQLERTITACDGVCVAHVDGQALTLCAVGERDSATADVTQVDGELTVDASGVVLDRLTGGIYADGTFEVGGWGLRQGEVLVHVTGSIGGGALNATIEMRGRANPVDTSVDCTVTYAVDGTRS